MAELDYAYLAEYARVDPGGSLTAVGASYTHVTLPTLPTQHLIAVAGRIRATTAEPSVLLRLIISDEAQSLSMSFETVLVPAPDARVYAGNKLGILFAFNTLMPITSYGTYDVFLELDGVEVRRLVFTVEQAHAAES